MDLGGWLRSLGLEQYEAAFRENAIDESVLPSLTAEDLKELGVDAVGHRRKLLNAIAALRAEPNAKVTSSDSDTSAKESAERRLLTVMFVDLVGSTALGARLDPEDLRDVIAAYHGCVTGLLARFEGFVVRYMGDGVLAYFGYPQAHEEDAERAIRAGMAIIDAVAQLNTIAGPPGTLSTRIGIATGVVVVGDLIGSGSSLETLAVGDTPNLAARLQASADPGKVVISDSTRLLTGDLFEYRELVLSNLKGRPAPERAWTVVGESMIDSRFEALRRGRLALVGRLEELELLLRRWDKAGTGEGRVVLLAGEPGMGKSHLVAVLEQKVNVGPNLCLRFLCSPHHHDTPLYPVIRHIERAANLERGDSPATKWEKLKRLLGSSASEEDIAVLADLLSVAHSAAQLPKTISPQRLKAMTFVAIIRLIDNLTRQTTVLAILEDMHWADPTTLDLLDRLIERVPRLAMLLVATTRPEVQPPWSGRPHVTVQLLSGLDHLMAGSLINQVAGGRELPRDVVDRILAHADGVPLFIEELTKTVLHKESTHKNGERISPMNALSADVVPTSLHASLMARLDRLPVGKELAQMGAVIGREFSFETLQALSRLPATRLEHALAELVRAGIIIAHGQAPFATYAFKHALVQDTAYASLLRDRRREIHLRLAEALEKDIGGAAEPQLIGWHFAEAGKPEKSIAYYSKAADHATGRFALAEMVSHLRNALRQVGNLPDSTEKQRRELTLQVALGRALIDHQGSGSEEVRVTFERARELCFALDEMQLLAGVYDGLMLNYHFTHSQPQKMLQYASEMTEVHERTGDAQALLMARRARGLANLLLGRFQQAREEMQLVLDTYDAERDRPYAGMSTRDPKASICTVLGTCLTALGYPEAGAAMSLEGVKHAETLNHPISLILALRRACVQGMLERNTQRVIELSERLLAVRSSYETFKGNREGTIFHSWAQLRTRPEPVTFDRMEDSLRQLDASRNWALLPFFLGCAAELRGECGHAGTAVVLLDRAAELINITGERWCEAEIMRLRARFGVSNSEEAIALLQASLATARGQSAKLLELRSAATLAGLIHDHGDHAAARELLAPVYEGFTEGWATADLVAARALLDELGQRSDRAIFRSPS
jgi:class 3 adenylate cyclase/tetratricopeptide (TPR) repeat protein